jgi:peptidoglycan/xylan/chitin deacetylase (PgdA/CDA1 family)
MVSPGLARRGKQAFARLHDRWLARPGPPDAGRILCYHNVEPRHAAAFSQQLEFLRARYHVLPLSEFLGALGEPTATLPRLAITFDDGYRDNYDVAFDLLRRAGLPAAFFVVSGVRAHTAAERAAAPEPAPGGWSPRLFMTWQELAEMSAHGMEIHLHSHQHQNTARLSREQLAADIRANRQAVVEHVRREPAAYAVPFGRPRDCHPELAAILKAEGIPYALLATHGWNDARVPPYRLHRDAVDPSDSVGYLGAVLRGCFDWLG